MSKSVLFFVAMMTFVVVAFAQTPIVITEKTVTMSKGEQPAFIVEIPQATAENVKKTWEKYIRQNTKSKVSEENNEIAIENTKIDAIGENPLNIYSALYQIDSAVKLVALFEIDSSFFSFDDDRQDMNYERTYQGIKHFMHDFAVREYKKVVEQELKDEEKELKTLNKELQNIVKQTESFQKKIKQNESDSLNAEDRIKSLETDKERNQGEIDSKKQSMSSITSDKELLAEAKKHLKSLEKERKKIEKEIQKFKEKVVECHTSKQELKRNIEENNKLKEDILNKINLQKETVKSVTEKLANIK